MSNIVALPGGTELVGDYRIARVLGAGGFGITYLADELALARRVTIKEYFPTDFAARDGAVDASPRSRDCAKDYKWGLDRFIDEAQTLAKFDHPNIVRVYRYFRANNTGYMVLQWEEGKSFKTWLKGLKRAPRQAELDTIVGPLLDALEIIHKGDFLHRDIAPDNIIIRKNGQPVLIDFGSARSDVAQSRTVSALVKPGYSPYEQYASTSRNQGPWTDIYALGATLYHAVTGKRPPDAPSRMVQDDYIPARDCAVGGYRQSFLDAIDKSLKLDVAARPQTVAAWRGGLLAPDEAPAAARGPLGLGFGMGRRAKGDEAKPKSPLIEKDPTAGVPPPPDAPQPKGQLLDFIDGLKKPGSAAIELPPPDAGGNKTRAGLGYGPAPDEPGPAAAVEKPAVRAQTRAATARAKTRVKPEPAKPEKAVVKAEPVPRSVRSRAKSRWRSIGIKVLVALFVATTIVMYEDRLGELFDRLVR